MPRPEFLLLRSKEKSTLKIFPHEVKNSRAVTITCFIKRDTSRILWLHFEVLPLNADVRYVAIIHIVNSYVDMAVNVLKITH